MKAAKLAALTSGLLFALACQPGHDAAQGTDTTTVARDDGMAGMQMSANEQMSRGPMGMSPHMELTPPRPASPADSARAATLVVDLRRAIARYQDVKATEADGFRMFAPQIKRQRVYHFTNWWWALANAFRFDPSHPTSLLYRKSGDSSFVLVGAMYTAPASAALDELDRRVPLAVARWHRHVNWCIPPRGAPERWRETRDGKPVFGPLGVTTKEACDAAGGRFFAHVFGWMVHVNLFAGDDPKVIWGGDSGGDAQERMPMH